MGNLVELNQGPREILTVCLHQSWPLIVDSSTRLEVAQATRKDFWQSILTFTAFGSYPAFQVDSPVQLTPDVSIEILLFESYKCSTESTDL
jgi:hypothetical protein